MESLAIMTIKANKYFVFVDTSMDQNGCNGITGSRWIDNKCYALGSAGKPRNQVGNGELRKMVSYMDASKVGQLDDPSKGYDFDVKAFYQTAQDCENAGGGDVSIPAVIAGAAQSGTSYPRCFVNIPVITADSTPCNDKSHDRSSLGYDASFCNPPGGPGEGGGTGGSNGDGNGHI